MTEIRLNCGHTYEGDPRDVELGDRIGCPECPPGKATYVVGWGRRDG